MKKTLMALLVAAPLAAAALNWTNYPSVTTPADNDTLMVGTSITNQQWAVSNAMRMARLLPASPKSTNSFVTNEVVVVATNSSLVFNLPSAASWPGRQVWFLNNIDVTNTRVRCTNGWIIGDGFSTTNLVLTNAAQGVRVYAFGTNWFAR